MTVFRDDLNLKEGDSVEANKASHDMRTYLASAIFVGLVIALMLFLTFIEIPEGNKDLIVTIIAMLVGGTGVAMGNLFGTHDEETEDLKVRLRTLEIEYAVLKQEYDKITKMLVDRHVVEAVVVKKQ